MTKHGAEYRVNNLCRLEPTHPYLGAEVNYQINQLRMPKGVEKVAQLIARLSKRKKELANLRDASSHLLIEGLSRAIDALNDHKNRLRAQAQTSPPPAFAVGPGTADQKPPGGWASNRD